MALFLVWLVLSILVGFYAESKGHSGVGWFLLSVLISPLICFIIELVRPPNIRKTEQRAVASGEMKKCPACAEMIRAEAIKCRYCGEALAAPATAAAATDDRQQCSQCGNYTTGAAYCGVCGKPLTVARAPDKPAQTTWGG